MDAKRWLRPLVAVGGIALLAAAMAGPDWTGERAARRTIEARNAAFARGRPPLGLVQPLQADLDRVDEASACLPVHGLVDRTACAQAGEAYRRMHPAG